MAANAYTPSPSNEEILKTVNKAVNALLKWHSQNSKTTKPKLLEDDGFVYLILTLKKIPQQNTTRINPYKILLPNPLIDLQTETKDLCLIIDDRHKSCLKKEDVSKKIQSENIPISKIIKLSKLKSDYKAFEEKRKLCDSFDMFFADKGVVPLLPKLLGKQFFRKRKIPVGVDLRNKNWREQIEKGCGSGLLYLRSGTCSVVKVGKVSMGKERVVENVVAAIYGVAEIVPRKWGGIRSFHLKLLESLALPVYQAIPDMKLSIESGGGFADGEEEVVAVEKEKEKVGKKKKGRINEVRYMDGSLDDDLDEDGDSESDVDVGIGSVEVKKRKLVDEGKVDQNKVKKGTAKGDGGMKVKDGIKKQKLSAK